MPLAGMVLEPYAKDGKSKPKFKVLTPRLHVSFEASSHAECESWIRSLGDQIGRPMQAGEAAQGSAVQPVPGTSAADSQPQTADDVTRPTRSMEDVAVGRTQTPQVTT